MYITMCVCIVDIAYCLRGSEAIYTASHFIFTALKLHGYSQKKILLLDLILVAEDHFHHKLHREPKIKKIKIKIVCNNFHDFGESSKSHEN